MKIAIVGAGAMGSLFGGRLALLGHEVTMVDVVPAVIEAINTHGLIMEDESGRQAIALKAGRAEDFNEPRELVILFTKTMYSRAALESGRGLIGPETYVLSLQNGLGNMELISEFVPVDRILVGVTNMASDLIGPGHISSHGGGYTKIMSADGQMNPMVETLGRELVKAGVGGVIVPEIFVAIWEKVAFNAAINSTTAVCRTACGAIGLTEEGRALAFNIAREAARVANAHGVKASAEAVIASLENTFVAHSGHLTSMAQDIMHGRRTEVDFINGQICLKAREVGLTAPCTETLYALIKTIEAAYPAKS